MLADIPPLIDITLTPGSTEQPKITDWWSVGVALGALVVASFAAIFNWRTNQNQSKQLATLERESSERREDDKRKQAALVSGWLERIEMSTEPDNYPALVFRFKNGSDQPIYRLMVKTHVGVRGSFSRHLGTIGPGSVWQLMIYIPGHPRGEIDAPNFTFRDTLGRYWMRSEMGELSEISDEDYSHFYYEDAGAFESLEKHPTMRYPADPREAITRLH